MHDDARNLHVPRLIWVMAVALQVALASAREVVHGLRGGYLDLLLCRSVPPQPGEERFGRDDRHAMVNECACVLDATGARVDIAGLARLAQQGPNQERSTSSNVRRPGEGHSAAADPGVGTQTMDIPAPEAE